MTHLDRIKACTDQAQKILEQRIDHSNPDEISGRITELTNILGTSAEMVALAEMVYNEALGKLVEQFQDSKLSATDKKLIFAGRLSNENYYMTLTERQNRAITHAIDGHRSQLSFLKSEMERL